MVGSRGEARELEVLLNLDLVRLDVLEPDTRGVGWGEVGLVHFEGGVGVRRIPLVSGDMRWIDL